MKKIKRILALLMALCLVICLAACADSDNDDTSSRRRKKDKTSSSTSSGETSSGGDVIISGTTETVALFGDLTGTKIRIAEDAVLEDWELAFYEQLEEETGMTVEMEPMSSNELMNKISQAVASGDRRNYFDVGITSNAGLLNTIYSNLAIPMDDYIYYDDPVWEYDKVADFNSLDLFYIDGHYWGAPSYDFHENYIFYNKTYFEEVGAPDPYEDYYLKDNWTFDTFFDTCEAVTRRNDNGVVTTYAWATWNYFTFCSAAGNDMIEQDGNGEWQIVFDQPNGMAGLNVIYESVKNGWLLTNSSGYDEFVNRKVAMFIEKPSSAIGATDIYERSSDEICIVPFPKMNSEQEKYICPMIVSGYYIAACTQNPAGAAAYIYYHRLGEQNRNSTEIGKQNIARNVLNEESQARRDEYIAKCDFAVPFIDGLNGWYGGARETFLNVMRKEKKNPAVAVDTMIPLIRDCLRRTVI